MTLDELEREYRIVIRELCEAASRWLELRAAGKPREILEADMAELVRSSRRLEKKIRKQR